MRAITIVAALAFGGLGCQTAAPLRVVNAPPAVVYAQSIKALATHGFDCKVARAELICDDSNPDRPTIFVSYVPSSSRLVFVAFDRLDEPCEGILAALNRFNYEFDFAQVSCRDAETPMLFYAGNIVVPENGLTAKDLGGYAMWWSRGLITALRASGLVRRGGRRPDPRDAPEPTLRKL